MGKVYFIGAGPGDPELITLKGCKILNRCDVVIYAGSLVSEDILQHAPQNADVYNSAEMTLHDIITVMVTECNAGKDIARLHTGDPSIYGAILEQMTLLDEHGIEYENIPGVTSLFAAAAALQCELTVPEVSQTVIISRYAGRTPVPERFDDIAKVGGTLCLYLSASMADEIVEKLISTGRSIDTPAAIVYKASWADEKIVRGTLGTIAELAKNINNHTILIVGDAIDCKRKSQSKLYDKDFKHGYRS